MIEEGYRGNFESLRRAFANGDVCLAECTDKVTGKTVIVICAVQKVDEEIELVPFAKMFDGDPYEEVDPPRPTVSIDEQHPTAS
jgi:hypothetical protein